MSWVGARAHYGLLNFVSVMVSGGPSQAAQDTAAFRLPEASSELSQKQNQVKQKEVFQLPSLSCTMFYTGTSENRDPNPHL